MKLENVLSILNSLEKNAFLKKIDNILSENPKNSNKIESILSEGSKDLKNIDNINIAKIFQLVENEFTECIRKEFLNTESQLDILTDILTKDGRCIAKQEWFSKLYENELIIFDKKLKQFQKDFKSENSIDPQRRKDYDIYMSCTKVAYFNDLENNQDKKITSEEQSILNTLVKKLDLSQEETKLINYSVIPVTKHKIDDVINDLRNIGVIFFSKKYNTVYVPQEIIRILRKVRNKEIADKYFRRVLIQIKESMINIACRRHNIDWKMSLQDKIEAIISEGISFSGFLINSIYKEGTNLNDKKRYFNELCEKGLKLDITIKGVTIEEKVQNLIKYFEEQELEERVSISFDGYEKLLIDIAKTIPSANNIVRETFELQESNVMDSRYLLDYNIKPRDVLEIIPNPDLQKFIELKEIKSRGDVFVNILNHYKDSENLYLENYENIAYRNLNVLKENSINISEADLGVKFEELTRIIFSKLGFNVDEKLRKKINTKKDCIDILLNLGHQEIILIECKSVKESGYNKFSTVHRQLRSYRDLAISKDYKVVKSLLVAPEFSDNFINDCQLEYELNLSLITAGSLINILNGFKGTKLKQLPYKLLLRDVLIQDERVLKAIE